MKRHQLQASLAMAQYAEDMRKFLDCLSYLSEATESRYRVTTGNVTGISGSKAAVFFVVADLHLTLCEFPEGFIVTRKRFQGEREFPGGGRSELAEIVAKAHREAKGLMLSEGVVYNLRVWPQFNIVDIVFCTRFLKKAIQRYNEWQTAVAMWDCGKRKSFTPTEEGTGNQSALEQLEDTLSKTIQHFPGSTIAVRPITPTRYVPIEEKTLRMIVGVLDREVKRLTEIGDCPRLNDVAQMKQMERIASLATLRSNLKEVLK